MEFDKKILITGGAGFIGSHLVRHFVKTYPNYQIFNLDKLTYAGNPENIQDLKNEPNYTFIKGDICEIEFIEYLFNVEGFDNVIHLAAESHVDRSIQDPYSFIKTNILGTVNLLNAANKNWKDDKQENLFYHISTDEVFGSLDSRGIFSRNYTLRPAISLLSI